MDGGNHGLGQCLDPLVDGAAVHLALRQLDGLPRLHFPDDFQHLWGVDVLNGRGPKAGKTSASRRLLRRSE